MTDSSPIAVTRAWEPDREPSKFRSEYLTPQQLCQELGVSAKTLERWRLDGSGPPRLKVGRKVFFSVAELHVWMQSAQERPATLAPARRPGRPPGEAKKRLLALINAHPGITKAEVVAAMAPMQPNHTGALLATLCRFNLIAAPSKDGPYYPPGRPRTRSAR